MESHTSSTSSSFSASPSRIASCLISSALILFPLFIDGYSSFQQAARLPEFQSFRSVSFARIPILQEQERRNC
jgi:hypothetical protein